MRVKTTSRLAILSAPGSGATSAVAAPGSGPSSAAGSVVAVAVVAPASGPSSGSGLGSDGDGGPGGAGGLLAAGSVVAVAVVAPASGPSSAAGSVATTQRLGQWWPSRTGRSLAWSPRWPSRTCSAWRRGRADEGAEHKPLGGGSGGQRNSGREVRWRPFPPVHLARHRRSRGVGSQSEGSLSRFIGVSSSALRPALPTWVGRSHKSGPKQWDTVSHHFEVGLEQSRVELLTLHES
jgi:hypothetical protein